MTTADGNTVVSYLRLSMRASAWTAAPDEKLLDQFVTERDEAAFAALVGRHGPMVWGVCQRLLAHRQDAEDAFQATFLILARKAAAIGRRHLLANWLFGVARRAALNVRAMRARSARHAQSFGDLPDVQATVETPWDDVHAVLDEELARLPAKYRTPILLCGLEGMTHADAANQLGWPTGTVAGRLSRGRDLLRARLLKRGVTAPAAALAAVLAPDAVTAAVPPQLVAISVRSAAALVTTGQSAAAVVSPQVALLVRGVLRKMFLSRLLTTTAVLATLALTLAGAGALGHSPPSTDTPPPSFPPPSFPRSAWERTPGRSASLPEPHPELPPSRQILSATPTPGKPPIRLPSDPNALVVRMDRSLGTAAGSRMGLRIYADGYVVAVAPKGNVLTGKLTTGEIEAILRFAVHDQEFFAFNEPAVKAAIKDTYHPDRKVKVGHVNYEFGNDEFGKDAIAKYATDTTASVFHIQTASQTHEVHWSRLGKTAWDYPKVERLLQLHALEQRLSQVYYVLQAGGPERVEAVAAKLDGLLGNYYCQYPDAPRLTAADLLFVTPSEDGSHAEFVFSRSKDRKVRNMLFEAAIRVPCHGEPTLGYVIPPGIRIRGGVIEGATN